MINDIQLFLKNIISSHSSLTNSQIFMLPVSSQTPKPSVSIIPEKGTFTPVWSWESPSKQQGNKRVQQKYLTTQPLILHFVDNDKNSLINNIQDFLEHLPRYGLAKAVEFTPINIQYILSEGVLGTHQSIITINASYGISQSYSYTLIKDVSINEEYKNK